MNGLIPLSVSSSSLYTGTVKLLNDISTALLVILPISAVIAIVFCAIRRMMADEHEAPIWMKRIVAIIICAVIGVVASGTLTIITGYYS